MANWYVCMVRDRAIDSFGKPFVVAHLGEALRAFTDEVNRKDSPYNAHPDDYDLYQAGIYDDTEGTFNCGVPRQIAVGKDVVK